MMRKTLHVSVAVLILVAATTFAPAAHAAPGYYRTVVYYDGCGENMVEVGWATRDCNGHWTYSGQQSGHWKWIEDESCYNYEIYDDYYEYCNGAWVLVSQSNFGVCSC